IADAAVDALSEEARHRLTEADRVGLGAGIVRLLLVAREAARTRIEEVGGGGRQAAGDDRREQHPGAVAGAPELALVGLELGAGGDLALDDVGGGGALGLLAAPRRLARRGRLLDGDPLLARRGQR